ncbi:MAG: prepilin-type N-terminal cleavage/methylation domain-containing protein [Candidatus Omnitrophota bacterium]
MNSELRTNIRTNKGFTLIEILATVAIIGIGIVPVMNILPEGMKSIRKVEYLTRSVMLAQQKMDEVRSLVLGTNAGYGYDKAGGYDDTGTFTSFTDYAYEVEDDQGADIRELSVTVWFDENGNSTLDAGEDSVKLDTKIAKR